MLSDKLFIIRLTADELRNFAGFGYSLRVEYDVNEQFAKGILHRFAIFYHQDKQITFQTIKKEIFPAHKKLDFAKAYKKADETPNYTFYHSDIFGEPLLLAEEIKNPHLLS